ARRRWRPRHAARLLVLARPLDRDGPAVRTHHGASHRFSIGEALTARLQALAAAEQTTLFTVLLAALQVLLARYSGEEDVVVGSITAGRHRPRVPGPLWFPAPPPAPRGPPGGPPPLRAPPRHAPPPVLPGAAAPGPADGPGGHRAPGLPVRPARGAPRRPPRPEPQPHLRRAVPPAAAAAGR